MQYMELITQHKSVTKKLLNTRQRLSLMPEGYISPKKIAGKTYYYLQKRKQGQMCGRYIKVQQLPETRKALSIRKKLEAEIIALSRELEALEKAAAILDPALHRSMVQNKRCLQMDRLPINARKENLSFANAMLSLEGVVPTKTAKESLQAWGEGKQTFAAGYLEALRQYNLLAADRL